MKHLRFFLILLLISFGSRAFAQAPGCPNVTITAPGASGGQVTIPCNDCITLTANVLHTGLTNTYTVSSIPYAPPYPYNSGTPILVNIDDTWSGVIALPFTFCYFGTGYNQVIAGSNGVVSFDLSDAGGYCPWSFTATCPSASLPTNAIFGAYHDIDPGVSGTMYQGILGSYPCRTFVVNWYQIAMFSSSCNYLLATHQIVLYEATNVIEVYIQNKPLCPTWNSGNAVVGIQNAAGTTGFVPPGRNTGQWTATNEAWRFTPNGAPNYTIQWYEGPVFIGSGATINVCPTVPTTYTAIATYDNCNFTQVVVTDEITVNPGNLQVGVTPATSDLCQGESVNLTASATGNGPFTYAWGPASGLNTTTGPNVTASPTTTTTYVVTITDALGCSGTVDALVTMNPNPTITTSATENPICVGQSSTISASGGSTYSWNSLGAGQSHLVNPTTTTTYTVTGTDAIGCSGTSSITLQVNPGPTITITNSDPDICLGENSQLTASGGDTYAWDSGQNSQGIDVSPSVTTTYTVTGTDVNGCIGTASSTVNVHPNPQVDFTGNPLQGCIPLNVAFTNQVVSPDPISTYSWSFGAAGTSTQANPSKVFSQAGTYDVSLTAVTSFGCSASLTKPNYVEAYPIPVASFIATPSIAELGNSLITFVDQSTGATQWYWNFGDGGTSYDSNPTHLYEQAGQFEAYLLVTNQYGCRDSTWRWIQILYNISFYVPNAFSPNDNGQNDQFGPVGVGIKAINFYIYDRWGKMVWESHSMDERWDGKVDDEIPNQSNVFIWKAEVTFVNGLTEYYTGEVLMVK